MAAQWNQYTTYAIGDVVGYIGQEYAATVANINTPPFPATPTWALITPPLPPGAVTNPLTADLDCATFDVFNGTTFNTATVECDTIDPKPGSLATFIDVNQSLRVAGAGNDLESDNDVLGRVGTATQTSLNTVADEAGAVGGFYKTSAQAAPTGATDITWDATYAWGDPLGCFSIVPGGVDITCAVHGVYEIAANLFNQTDTSTAAGTNLRILSFDITRAPNPEVQGVVNSTFYNQTNVQYNQVVQGVIELLVGDILNVRLTQTLTGGSSSIRESVTLDPNTWMTYKLYKRLP